jgi:hypothetical protein
MVVAHRSPRLAAARRFFARRPGLLREAVVIVWLLWIYDAINNLSPVRATTAIAHARQALDLERTLGIAVERSINHWVPAHHLAALVIGDYYDNAHFVVTFGVLAWLWWARPESYRPLRRALVLINLIGFAVFWLWPMAPPRMLPGFVDTVATSGAFGSWHSGQLAEAANQYAAMPSLHVAWAVWSGVALWCTCRRRTVRTLAVLYPVATTVAVLVTANHLLLDSLAGVATGLLSVAAERRGTRHWLRLRARRRPEPSAEDDPAAPTLEERSAKVP